MIRLRETFQELGYRLILVFNGNDSFAKNISRLEPTRYRPRDDARRPERL